MTCEVCQPLADRGVIPDDEDILCPCEAEDLDLCVNCGHPVEKTEGGRIHHRGEAVDSSGELISYRQTLCWKDGCDCETPEVSNRTDTEEGENR